MLNRIPPSQILFLKADKNYTEFHLENGRKYVSGYTLKYHQNREEVKDFLRISNSFLLNPTFIETVTKTKGVSQVLLINGTMLTASRRRQIVLENYKQE